MSKRTGKLHQINEEILVKAEIAINVSLGDLDEQPDLRCIRSIKAKILKQIASCLEEDPALETVAYSLEILGTRSRSVKTCEDTVRDDED